MAIDMQNSREPGTVELVAGIIDDAQRLIKQQMELTRQEIARDIRRGKEAAWLYAIGVGTLFSGGIVLCFAVAHLLHWATSPMGSDAAAIPLWVCYLAVGGVAAMAGGFLIGMGEAKCASIHPLESPAVQALKKNVDWVKHEAAPVRFKEPPAS